MRSVPRLLLVFLLIVSTAVCGESKSQIKSIPDLRPASDYPAEKIDEISRLAFRHWQFLAEESAKVVGTFKTIRSIPSFSQSGDLIWEVRIIHLTQIPTGVLWVNDRTKDVIVLGNPK